MPKVMLATMVGKESLASASSKVFVYHEPHGIAQRHLTEQTLNALVKDPGNATIIRKVGVPVITPAVIGVKPEIGGDWNQQSYEIEEGEIVKIFASRKQVWNKLPETACVLIQMRANAPLHKLSAKLVGSSKARFKLADFTGRFDVITMEEAVNKGVVISPQFRHLFAERLRDACFVVQVLEPEVAPAPAVSSTAVQTPAGQTRVVQVRERRRALEM